MTLVRLQLRLSRRGAIMWGVLLSVGFAANMGAWSSAYPTQESRTALARSLSASTGFRALVGPPLAVDTTGGFVAWRLGVFALGALGVWALLTTTRLLRGEEDAGRWDLVLSMPLTKRRATLATVAAVLIDIAIVWAVASVALVGIGSAYDVPAGGSLAFTSGLALGACLFAALAAFASQLAPARRTAAGIAGAVLGAAFLVRSAADGSSATWLRWASPFGWLSELRSYAGARPAVLLLYVAVAATFAAAAVWIAGRRDSGAGTLPSRDRATGGTAAFRTPEGASFRFAAAGAAAWIAGAAAFGLMMGALTPTITQTLGGSGIERFVQELGTFRSVRGYLAFGVYFTLGLVLSLVVAGSVASHWEEERTGRAETALCGAIGRRRWLAGRLAATAATAVTVAVVASVAAWAGVRDALTPAGALGAGIAVLPVAAVFLGAGVALYGLAPRIATGTAYGFVACTFLLQVIGSIGRWPRWLLGLSPFHHASGAPLLGVNVRTSLLLLAVGAAGVVLGVEAFARRDLQTG